MTTDGSRLRIGSTEGALAIAGEIDAHSCDELDAALAGAPDGDVAVDLSEVTFIDSSGLRVLVQHHQGRAGAGHTLQIVRPSRAVRRLLEIAGLDGEFLVDAD